MGGYFSSPKTDVTSFHQLSALDIDKNKVDFSTLKGKVVLATNKYGDKGLVIMAFPCNQFAMQEPGTNAQIKEFAKSKGFTGMLMDKVKVNGAHASPVFQFLKVASGDESLVAWNFAKWLVKKDGSVHGRYGPRTNPMSLEDEIKTLLDEEASSL
ncbi:Glutathione peroxidase 1 [Picochlorum sp. SENEW3]|nr:Glutathione peroxidase 1 [Picochlorum sp. SENEW3]WPT15903.1 Glutathione peroxidase 1 [Picochlorum sp. SENEW3]